MSTSSKADANKRRVLLAFGITLLLICPPAYAAQVLYGSLTGTITDSTDAIVPGRGPGFFEADASIYRTFAFTERVQFQLRAEALNATNHANFANPSGDINASTFGFITATTGPNQSRQWRFGARVSF